MSSLTFQWLESILKCCVKILNPKSGHTADRKCHHLFSINFLSGCAVYQQAKEQLRADFVFPSRKNIYPIYPISR